MRIKILALVSLGILLSPIIDIQAEDRAVFPGAIIFHDGATPADAFSDKLTRTLRVLGAESTVREISASAYRLDLPIEGVDRHTLTPYPYEERLDPCRRARARNFMKSLGGRARCTPNWAMRAEAVTPNDPELKKQWAVTSMQLPDAWQITQGSDQVVIGVVDTGMTLSHPDLAANLWVNPGEIPGDGIDNDRNGYIDDVHGWNAITNAGNPEDDNGHGTHVAGIIGAVGNNGIGISGVAWKVRLMPLKFLNSQGGGGLADALDCLEYVRVMKNRGVNIVATNNSWGGPGSITSLLTNTLNTLSNNGVLFIAAAGNSALNNDISSIIPGGLPSTNMISVASVTSEHKLSSFSNYGTQKVHIAAPGSDIYSTYPGNGGASGKYMSLNGTSMAAPQVSGVAALIASLGPLSMSERRSIILSTGTTVSGLSSKVASSSVVNAKNATLAAFRALGGVATPTIAPPSKPNPKPSSPTPIPGNTGGSGAPHSNFPTLSLTSSGALKIGRKATIAVTNGGRRASITVRIKPRSGSTMTCSKKINISLNRSGSGSQRVILASELKNFSRVTFSWKTASGSLQQAFEVKSSSRKRISSRQLATDFRKICRDMKAG